MKSKIIFAKLDASFFSNRKIMRAGRNGRDVYLFVLCQNQVRGANGCIPASDLDPWYLARQLGMTEKEAAEGVKSAKDAGLIEVTKGSVSIAGWDDEWARRSLPPSEKQQRYRDRKKTPKSIPADGNALPRGGNKSRDSLPDSVTSDRETVTSDHGGNALPIRVEESRGERVERGNAGPASPDSLSAFTPGPDAQRIAAERGLDLAHELAQFRDGIANGKQPRDLDAAFRKWLRGSRDTGRAGGNRGLAEGAVRVVAAGARKVSAQRLPDRVAYFEHLSDGNDIEISEAEFRSLRGEAGAA